MRVIFTCLYGVAFAWAACPAQADVLSYCEAYARNQADVHLSGSAVLGSKPNLTAAQRQQRNMLALADCLALYGPKPVIETVTAKPDSQPEPAPATVKTESQAKPETFAPQPIATPRAKQKTIAQPKQKTSATVARIEAATAIAPAQKKKPLADSASPVAGSKDYCAAKYASFNPATGTYATHSGKQRRCPGTDTEAPVRVTKTQLPGPRLKTKLPTQAAKSQPLPEEAAKKKSVWDSFDNPRLPISR